MVWEEVEKGPFCIPSPTPERPPPGHRLGKSCWSFPAEGLGARRAQGQVPALVQQSPGQIPALVWCLGFCLAPAAARRGARAGERLVGRAGGQGW